MKTSAIACLGIAAIGALLFGGLILWNYIDHWILHPANSTSIFYSSKQIDVLADAAKTLIPTITGFAVLAGSGAGYLHKQRALQSSFVTAGVAAVFVGIVISLACWILVFATIMDCSRAFARADSSLVAVLTQRDIRLLGASWAMGVTAAKLGTVSFFISVDAALFLAIGVFTGRRPIAKSK